MTTSVCRPSRSRARSSRRLLPRPRRCGGVEFSYNFVCRDDLEYDTVYAFLETLYEGREGLAEYHALLDPLADEEFWVENAYEDVPFHPAAADFYEEIGVWREEFERGED